MILNKFFWLFPSLLGVLASSVSAQLSVQDTLRECGVSPESLAVAGCSATHATAIIVELTEDTSVRLSLEQLQANLTGARAAKLGILQSLADADATNREQIQIALQAASDSEAAALLAYQQVIGFALQEVVDQVSAQQQSLLNLALRSDVQSLPAEYRVLPWSTRKLTKLGRALKLESASSHPLVIEAEALYQVQLARQTLLANRDDIAVVLDEQ